MRTWLIILSVIAILTTAVLLILKPGKDLHIYAMQPQLTDFVGYEQTELSTLTFPVSINLDDIEDKINDKLEDKPIHVEVPIGENGKLFMDMEFYNDIQMSWDAPMLHAIVPINFIVMGEATRLGVTFRNKEPVQARVMIKVHAEPELGDDWNLRSQTVIDSYEFIDQPTLKIGPLDINLTKIVDKQISANREKIQEAVGKRINHILKVRKAIEKIWNDVQKPIRLNKKGVPLWLRLNGTSLRACWQKDAPEPTVIVNVEGYYELEASSTRNYDSTFVELPPFTDFQCDTTGINAYVLARIPYSEIRDFVNPRLDTLKLRYLTYDIRLDDFDVYGGDSLLYFKLVMQGDVIGTVYLKGRPTITDGGKTVAVSEFNYDLQSEDALASTADGWLHDYLLEQANTYLQFELDSLIDELPDAMTRGIEKSRVGNKIDVTMDQLNVVPLEMRSAKDHLLIRLHVVGQGGLQLEKEVLNKKKKPV